VLVVAALVLLFTLPFACSIVAVAYAPAGHVDIAGHPVSVEPVLGQDTSRLLNGALVRPEHAHIGLVDKNVGVDIDADWNQIIPSDAQTRQYLTTLLDDPTPQINRIQDAARRHVVLWASVGFGVGLTISMVTILVLDYRRRRLAGYEPAQADLIRRHNRHLRISLAVLGVAGVVAVDLLAVRVWQHEDHHVVVSSPAFDDTSLEGTEVNGLAAEVVPFLSILRPHTNFYDDASANVEKALADEPSLQPTGDEVVMVLAEDFEDVNGMARVVGMVADLVEANFLAITGDLTFAGLPVETYIIDTIDYYSDGKPVYFTPGLHDTQVVVDAARARGWHVANGKTREVDGVTILMMADPRVSTVGNFGVGNLLRDPEVDTDEAVSQAIDTACDDPPDVVLLHDHLLGRRIAEAGCQEIAVLDGRSFEFVGPQDVPTGTGETAIEFTGGSTGGHVDTRPDPGNIKHPARFSVLTMEPDSDEATYSVITVNPDTSVTVTPEIDLRVPYQRFVDTGFTGLPPSPDEPGPGHP
jgi:hypothetical protein